jgi:hypothetical protein
MAGVETDLKRLTDLGVRNAEGLTIEAIKALGTLSDEELKALVKAQQAVGGRVHTMDGNIIF